MEDRQGLSISNVIEGNYSCSIQDLETETNASNLKMTKFLSIITIERRIVEGLVHIGSVWNAR